ncbi:hypothetical protein FQZ97_1063600 [compost metagenome]
MVAEQVDHQDAVGLQVVGTVVVEGLRAQFGRLTVVVETVNHQHVASRLGAANKGRAVTQPDRQPVIVRRDAELVAQGQHVRVDLGHLDARAGQVAVTKLGQRPAAQADHPDVPGFRLEQQEAHHCAQVL